MPVKIKDGARATLTQHEIRFLKQHNIFPELFAYMEEKTKELEGQVTEVDVEIHFKRAHRSYE